MQEVKDAFEPFRAGSEPSDPTIFGDAVVTSFLSHFLRNLDLKDYITTTENILVPDTDEVDVNEFNNNTIVAETDNEEDQGNANLNQSLDKGALSDTPTSPTILNPSTPEEQGNMNEKEALAFLLEASNAKDLNVKSPETEIIPPSIEEMEQKLLDFEESGDEYEPPKDSSKDMFDSSYTSASSVYSGKLLHPIC